MKIVIVNAGTGKFALMIESGRDSVGFDCCVIDDEAHSNLGEVEARARADALRAVTGWAVCLDYELD